MVNGSWRRLQEARIRGVESKPMKILLLRHASPVWGRTDIPYDIPPGPPLSPQGEKEAEALARFVKAQGVVKLYTSPFERAACTASIISSLNGIPCMEDQRLTEWNEDNEADTQVRRRMASIFADAVRESAEAGPIGLVTHGGPVGFLLQELKIDPEKMAFHSKLFDGPNLLPPAGAWKAEQEAGEDRWNLTLEFVPKVS
jgi:broad specificity phosphatase PhoE